MTGLSVRGVLSRVEAMDDWLLTDAEWAAAGAALDALAEALGEALDDAPGSAPADRDDEGVRAALGRLQELEESRRARAQPGPQKSFIPQRQREQRNVLVQRLTLELNRDEQGGPGASAPGERGEPGRRGGPGRLGGPPTEADPG